VILGKKFVHPSKVAAGVLSVARESHSLSVSISATRHQSSAVIGSQFQQGHLVSRQTILMVSFYGIYRRYIHNRILAEGAQMLVLTSQFGASETASERSFGDF
jgi:hypothetical protein